MPTYDFTMGAPRDAREQSRCALTVGLTAALDVVNEFVALAVGVRRAALARAVERIHDRKVVVTRERQQPILLLNRARAIWSEKLLSALLPPSFLSLPHAYIGVHHHKQLIGRRYPPPQLFQSSPKTRS